MTKGEIKMLKDLLEYEIFHLEGVVNAFESKESIKSLRNLKSIHKALQKPDIQINNSLNKNQKEILLSLIKLAQIEAKRVLNEHEKIKKIQQDSNILNSLAKSLEPA